MRSEKLAYVLSLLTVLLVFAVEIAPAFVAFGLSLQNSRFFRPSQFVGLSNYVRVFTDPAVRAALGHSLVFTFSSLALTFTLGLALALLFHHLQRLGNVLLTILLIPWAISRVVGALLWKWILIGHQGGLLAYMLSLIGRPPPALFEKADTAMAVLVFVAVWRTLAFAAVMLLAGLKAIPDELYKSAQVDGASPLYQLRRITLPLLKNAILIVLSILTISYFNEVTIVIAMTGGGPAGGTEVLSYLLYRIGYLEYNFGYGNALAVLMFLLNLGLVFVYMRLLRSEGRSVA